jgi:hypothetical protein
VRERARSASRSSPRRHTLRTIDLEDPYIGHRRHLHGRRGRTGARAGARGRGQRPGGVPAHVDPARNPRHRAAPGLRPGAHLRRLRPGRGRQRALARQPGGRTVARRGSPLHLGRPVAGRERAARARHHRGCRHPRQDHHHQHPDLSAAGGRARAGLPGGRRCGGFRGVGAAWPGARIRGGGRRVRHRVLRQAQQVRALPAAGGDPQQPGVRPRGHLRRRGRDPAPVPPPGADRAAARTAAGQRRGPQAGRGAGDGLLDASGDIRPGPGAGHAAALAPVRRSTATAASRMPPPAPPSTGPHACCTRTAAPSWWCTAGANLANCAGRCSAATT